jgi:hypothetical protein
MVGAETKRTTTFVEVVSQPEKEAALEIIIITLMTGAHVAGSAGVRNIIVHTRRGAFSEEVEPM